MQILADENLPLATVQALRAAGHDVVWVRTHAPGASDSEVLDKARRDRRLLVTLDRDFGELAFRQRIPVEGGIILLRLGPLSPGRLAVVLLAALDSRDDWAGCFSVVEPGRVRMTPLRHGE